MAREKMDGPKLEARSSKTLHRDFKRRCKKLNVSAAQRIRDLVQRDLKDSKRRRK